MAKADFFRSFVTDLGDADTSVAADGQASSEFSGWVDTGSYALNAAFSGSIYGGMPNNKALVLAGESTTGKSFFALGIVNNFLQQDPRARVFYFDTESAITNDMLVSRGIDPTRVAKSEPDCIEKFRTVAITVLDQYAKLEGKDRFPLLIVLDSLSMLPSKKEIGDMTEGKDTRDMTKPGLIKGVFRVLRLKLAKVQVPMVITNHVYAQIGAYVPTKTIAGGSGAIYAADTIAMLSKSKERNADKEVIGNIVHVKMEKSRLSREQTKIDCRIRFDGGLDRYYGLLELAEECGVVKKVSTRYEFPDGSKVFENAIWKTPTKYFTKTVLDAIEAHVKNTFSYNGPANVSDDVTEEELEPAND